MIEVRSFVAVICSLFQESFHKQIVARMISLGGMGFLTYIVCRSPSAFFFFGPLSTGDSSVYSTNVSWVPGCFLGTKDNIPMTVGKVPVLWSLHSIWEVKIINMEAST